MFQLEPRHSPGFMKYAITLSPALSGPFLSTISNLMVYDTIQSTLLSNRLTWFGFECVCDARNWTQHQLMSLPSSKESPLLTTDIAGTTIFSIVRNALIVYSLIAVFPLPLSTAPFPELATKLELDIFEVLEDDDENTASTSLLLWASTMGALAAIGTPQRAALVAITARLCEKLLISSWESMQAVLQDYLWSRDISDFDGMFLFLDVQNQMDEQDAVERSLR
ncbi:uncharacterized protein A1O9_02340 [Exophiala aquamarina CBS 119918]|uniref:Transcription factor domain-containing protein n=1 Tax=Exophiala aquamarina CBS 119918 TaxID=1182545 RepID=A0A072PN99_9EURO|nr:uncharacterized protein A1O9_02340 [Exophiala aquamarina CBS 119918]KEF60778.1 hypothetical protein A1O9_02340 [Exophiala aquamarina CBS 119918]